MDMYQPASTCCTPGVAVFRDSDSLIFNNLAAACKQWARCDSILGEQFTAFPPIPHPSSHCYSIGSLRERDDRSQNHQEQLSLWCQRWWAGESKSAKGMGARMCVCLPYTHSLPCMAGTSPSLRKCDSDLGLASREISGRKPQ